MPITYRIDEGQQLVVTKIFGQVDEAEVRAHAAAAARDPKVHACPRAIVEISEWVESTVASRVISELAMTSDTADEPVGRRVALIAPSDSSYGLARVFQGFRAGAGSGGVQVFRTRAEAEAWLGIGASNQADT